jgi:hypothetical protein
MLFMYDDGANEAGVVRAYFDAVKLWTNEGGDELLDGGFEDDENRDGRPDFWSGANLDDAKQIAYLNIDGPHEGFRDLAILDDDGEAGSAVVQAMTVQGSGAIQLVVSFAGKAAVAANLKVEVVDRSSPNPPLYSHTFGLSTSWQSFDDLMSIPTPAGYRDLFFSFVPMSPNVEYKLDDAHLKPPVAIGVDSHLAGSLLRLSQGWPNPTRGTAVIPYALGSDGHVKLKIYDVAGRLVRQLVDERQAAGERVAVWDGRGERGGEVTSGVYFYELDVNGKRLRQKIVVVE